MYRTHFVWCKTHNRGTASKEAHFKHRMLPASCVVPRQHNFGYTAFQPFNTFQRIKHLSVFWRWESPAASSSCTAPWCVGWDVLQPPIKQARRQVSTGKPNVYKPKNQYKNLLKHQTKTQQIVTRSLPIGEPHIYTKTCSPSQPQNKTHASCKLP